MENQPHQTWEILADGFKDVCASLLVKRKGWIRLFVTMRLAKTRIILSAQTIRTTLDFAKSTISGNKRFDKLCWKPSSGYWLGMLLSYRMRGNTKNAGIDWKRKGVMLQMTAERRKKEAAWESTHKTVCMHRLKQGNCHMDCNGKRIRCRGLLSAFSTPRETIGERFFALCISDLSFVMADMFMCLALVDLYFLSLTHVLFPLSG